MFNYFKGVQRMKRICILAAAFLAAAPLMLWAAADGAKLYEEKCVMCHGAKGEGNKDIGMPSIKGTEMTAEKLAAFLLKGESGRTIHSSPVGQLNEEQSKAVAEFVKKLE